MTRNSKFARNAGFSLIEVLVAIVILSVGLLALASLQLALLRSSAESKTQSIAAALAKQKIEQLRVFSDLAGYRALGTTSPETEALNDSGGNQGGVNFSRVSRVARYVYNKQTNTFDTLANTLSDAAITGLKDGTHDYVLGKDFKRMAVTVSWIDAAGVAARVAMEDVVDSNVPTEVANIVKNATGTLGPRKIKVKIYDPATDKMVIPIALGNGVNSAATNPKPQVVKGANTVETQFDVLTYSGLNANDGTALAQAKVETRIVACTCDIGEKPASTVRGLRPSYWNGVRYTVPEDVADYSPPAAADTESAASQSDRCSICCRDHHDPVGVAGPTFSPLRATKVNGVVTVGHPHYASAAVGSSAVTSGTYKEACRIVRTDGIWSVAPDLQNDYFGLLATGDGSNADTFIPDTTTVRGSPTLTGGAVARYQQFVLDYMKQRFVDPTPSTGAEQATYNTVGSPASLAGGAKFDLDYPTSVSIPLSLVSPSGKWLHSRGLYVDYLETAAVDAITTAKGDPTCNTAVISPPKTAAEVLKECVLKLLPFTSINLSELADWTPQSGILTVSNNEYYKSSSDPSPVRGRVNSAASSATNVSAVSTTRASNSGLFDIAVEAISPTDATPLTDTQAFAIGGGATPPTEGNGIFRVTLTQPTGYVSTFGVNSITPTPTPTLGNCNLDTGTPALYDYLCQVTAGSAGTGLSYTGSPGMSVLLSLYNVEKAGTGTTAVANCTYAGTTPGTWPLKSSGTTSHAINTCYNYDVQAVPMAKNTTLNADALSYVVTNPGQKLETTQVNFSLINRGSPDPAVNIGDNVSIIFQANPVGTPVIKNPLTCTYTCGMEQGNDCKSNKPTNFQFATPPPCD